MAKPILIAAGPVAVGLCIAGWNLRPCSPGAAAPSTNIPQLLRGHGSTPQTLPPSRVSAASAAGLDETPDDTERAARLRHLAARDPVAAIRWVEGSVPPEARPQHLLIVATEWIRCDPPAALEFLILAGAEELLQEAAPLLVEHSVDPAALLALLATLPESAASRAVGGQLLDRWAAGDGAAALAWARSLDDGPAQQTALARLAAAWLAADPREAIAYAQSHSADNPTLLTSFANAWLARDTIAAMAWAAQLPEGPERARVLPGLVAAWAQAAPRDAASFACTLPPGDTANEALAAVISGWAAQDPAAALEWAAQFPRGPLHDQALTHAVSAWAVRDAASAAEWLARQPDNPSRDIVADNVSGLLFERHPHAGFTFAESIVLPGLRELRLENLARRWLALDHPAATQALSAAGWPSTRITALAPTP